MAEFQKLEQRVADRTRRLSALYDILEVASDGDKPQGTIERILGRVLRAIGVDAGTIHLLDDSGEQLQLVAQHGLSEHMLDASSILVVPESPLAGWVVRHGELLLIPHISEDVRSASLAEQNPYDVYIGVPIAAAEEIYGVLSVLAHEATRFMAQEEIDLLVSVGEQIGTVVENAHLRQQAEQLMIVEERNRLARELHDSVTQSLYSVTLFAEAGRRMIAAGETEQAAGYLEDVAETGQQALKEMRLLVHRLRPSVLAEEGLAHAIQHRLNAVEGRAGIRSRFDYEVELTLSPAMEEAIYYITQEALNNALKHAQASEVAVLLLGDENGKLELQIVDNGRGFDPASASKTGGLGLTSMKERADMLGGTITCASVVGQGTTLLAQFDLSNINIVGAGFLGYSRREK
jgi:signal transduction histidine kinase